MNATFWETSSAAPIAISRQAGIYVRSRREELGLSRKELAARAGVSERSLTSLELGDAPGTRLDRLLAILNAVGLKLEVTANEVDSAAYREKPAASGAARESPSDTASGTSSYQDAYQRFVQTNLVPVSKNA